jgi:hypothetical protein
MYDDGMYVVRGYVVGSIPVIPELSGQERSKREFEALRFVR